MSEVGTETTYRFPGAQNGRQVRLAAKDRCPVGSHEVQDVYKVDGGYEAVVVRIAPPNSPWDYDRAVEAHRRKPKRFPKPDPKDYDLSSRQTITTPHHDHRRLEPRSSAEGLGEVGGEPTTEE